MLLARSKPILVIWIRLQGLPVLSKPFIHSRAAFPAFSPFPGSQSSTTPGKQPFLREYNAARLGNRWSSQARRCQSFWIGGTNAHIILEEALPEDTGVRALRPHNFSYVRQNRKRAEAGKSQSSQAHTSEPGTGTADIAYTLQVGRPLFPIARLWFVKSARMLRVCWKQTIRPVVARR